MWFLKGGKGWRYKPIIDSTWISIESSRLFISFISFWISKLIIIQKEHPKCVTIYILSVIQDWWMNLRTLNALIDMYCVKSYIYNIYISTFYYTNSYLSQNLGMSWRVLRIFVRSQTYKMYFTLVSLIGSFLFVNLYGIIYFEFAWVIFFL